MPIKEHDFLMVHHYSSSLLVAAVTAVASSKRWEQFVGMKSVSTRGGGGYVLVTPQTPNKYFKDVAK